MDKRLILVSLEGKEKNKYLEIIEPLDVEVDTVSSFKDLQQLLTDKPYQGVMIDLKTKIKSSKNEKKLTHEILDQFPVVQLTVEGNTGEVKSLFSGKSEGTGSLEEFIKQDCASFPARSLRASVRSNIHFNTILSKTGGFQDCDVERTITIDISKGGCFVYSCYEWERKKQVSLILNDLEDKTSIVGEIRWKRPWGSALQIPGIGIKFLEIAKSQLNEIFEIRKVRR